MTDPTNWPEFTKRYEALGGGTGIPQHTVHASYKRYADINNPSASNPVTVAYAAYCSATDDEGRRRAYCAINAAAAKQDKLIDLMEPGCYEHSMAL